MKKILAIFLAVALLCTPLLMLNSGATSVNAEYDVEFTKKAPKIDGVVDSNEYGKYPISTFDIKDYSDEFVMEHYKITDDDLSFEFYATWDADNFYMAWVVHTSYDSRVPDDVFDAGSGNMWMYSCVQFIITPGAPKAGETNYQTAEWSGNYLEAGLTLRNDDKSSGVCWSQPEAAKGEFGPGDWEFAGYRDEKKGTTTYEVRLPFVKSGIATKGDDAQFGLTYAVAAQEDYNKTPGMVEWQDAILGGKHADNAAIMTMSGSGMKQEVIPTPGDRKEGKLPEGLKDNLLRFDSLNKAIEADKSTLLTNLSDPITGFNTTWSYCMLLRPAEKIKELDGYYTVVATYPGDGTMTELSFGTDLKEGDIVAVFHGDEGGAGHARKELAASLPIGQKVYLFGFEIVNGTDASFKYSNAQLCIVEDPAAPLYDTTWILGDDVIVFSAKEDMKVTINGEEKAFTMSDKGVLKIAGTKTPWEITEDGKLVLDGVTYDKVGEADVEELQSLIANAEALVEGEYTEESFAAVKAALADAKAKLEETLDSRNQGEIDALKTALEEAVKALEKKPDESSAEPEPETSADESKPEESAAEPSAQEPEESKPVEQTSGGFPWWAWLLIGVGGVAVIGVIIAVVLKSKNK